MMLNEKTVAAYTAILQEELLPATGCTEPIAVAYCAAKLREALGGKPEEVLAEVSGNILKNVKSVVVPNTGGRRGIEAAIAVGIVAGSADAGLQVLANVTEEDVAADIFKYDLPAMPVVDEHGTLLGIVTTDDAWDAIEDDVAGDKTKMNVLSIAGITVASLLGLFLY